MTYECRFSNGSKSEDLEALLIVPKRCSGNIRCTSVPRATLFLGMSRCHMGHLIMPCRSYNCLSSSWSWFSSFRERFWTAFWTTFELREDIGEAPCSPLELQGMYIAAWTTPEFGLQAFKFVQTLLITSLVAGCSVTILPPELEMR